MEPCPFCGSIDIGNKLDPWESLAICYFCSNCFARTSYRNELNEAFALWQKGEIGIESGINIWFGESDLPKARTGYNVANPVMTDIFIIK